MKAQRILPFLIPLLAAGTQAFSQSIDYISPRDHSILVSLRTTIIVRADTRIDPASVSPGEFSVSGSISGNHDGTARLSDDERTMLFLPATPFAANENVAVSVGRGIRTADGMALPPVTTHFTTTPLRVPIESPGASLPENEPAGGTGSVLAVRTPAGRSPLADSLPSDFPTITVGTSHNPAPEDIFLANKGNTSGIGYYLMIVSRDGSVVKYKKVPQQPNLFKMEANGYLSFAYANGAGGFFIMDSTLTPVDTFQCGNGYKGDAHDFLLLPNGHAILFANDAEPVDMSQVVPGGNPDATVSGVVVQEVDASKNVVFQWRSWDYIPLTDSYFDLTGATIDLIHPNGLAVDTDGNILVSMRHLSSIVKIDRETGNVMWMLGGKQNDFTFVNEHESNAPTYFSYQHDVGVLPGGDITLFDNGNQHSPNYSRGAEYKLDQQNMTATLVWEFRHTPDIFAAAMGSVQRLPNGYTIVGWGQASSAAGIPQFTEVTPQDSTALEMFMPAGQLSYRAYAYQWTSQSAAASVNNVEVLPLDTYKFNTSGDTTGITITFNALSNSLYAYASVARYAYAPVNPAFTTTAPVVYPDYFTVAGTNFSSYTGTVTVSLAYYPDVADPAHTVVYARSGTDSSFVAMPTAYDPVKNVLTFTTSTLGAFTFGVPQTVDSSYAPAGISPADSASVNDRAPVKLVWGTRGIVQTYHLQVSTDPSYNSLALNLSGLGSTSYTMSALDSNATYYWRVNNTNASGTSDWSTSHSFRAVAPFIRVLYPDGSERLYQDSTYIVRWQSNISDTVNIDLMSGSSVASVIGDSLFSGTNAVAWHVPSTVRPDSTYTITVRSTGNAGLSGSSRSAFTISVFTTGIAGLNALPQSYALYQNYPNPFNPSTTIRYAIPGRSLVTLSVFNTLGQLVATLANGEEEAGYHSVRFDGSGMASGVYFCRLSASGFVSTMKMLILR